MPASFRFAILGVLSLAIGSASVAQEDHTLERDRAAIEQLHQLHIQATISGKADELAKLWDNDAVRPLPDSPAEVGKAAIYPTDKREENAGSDRNVCYKSEIKDLQIAGDWAYEWGYFSYNEAGMPTPIHGKVLRVIKRQPAGSWKFARVMAVVDKTESDSTIADTCK